MWFWPVNEMITLVSSIPHLNSGTNLRECEDQSWFSRGLNPGLDHYDKTNGFQITLPWHIVLSGVEMSGHTAQWLVTTDDYHKQEIAVYFIKTDSIFLNFIAAGDTV
jgi:hypothetical protein